MGDAPGLHRVHEGTLVFSGLDLGNVLVAVQPPRGYGDDPVAVYHSPNLAPTHHYLGFYRWLDEVWGADAIVHLGKHGHPRVAAGKGPGLSSGCWPDAALGDVPLSVPVRGQRPGEGAQAKRRTHAVVIDHLLPPMTRADTYDELAQLEQLFDEYAQLQSLDPPSCRRSGTDLGPHPPGRSSTADLGVWKAAPGEEGFDDFVLHVDGYLCELKDAQIRGGLHTLGPHRKVSPWSTWSSPSPGWPRATSPRCGRRWPGHSGSTLPTPLLDRVEEACRTMVEQRSGMDWASDPRIRPPLQWICDWLVPRLAQTTDEIANLLRGLTAASCRRGRVAP